MLRHLWWIVGLLLVGGGLAIALTAQGGPQAFSWFAYAPLSDGADWHMGWSEPGEATSMVIMTRWQLVGWATAVLGLVVLATGTGFQLGRRRAHPEQP